MGCGISVAKIVDTNGNLIEKKNFQPNMNSCEFKEIFFYKIMKYIYILL
jgi:hypothetical protein